MPQVSKRLLPKDLEEKMYEIFWDAFASLSNPSEIKNFLEDLLGPTEKTMLAKRLAIALLLTKGYTWENIKSSLKVTLATIARVNLGLKIGGKGYKKVINKFFQEEKMREFWRKIEDGLIAVLPPLSSTGKVLRHHRARRQPKGPLG